MTLRTVYEAIAREDTMPKHALFLTEDVKDTLSQLDQIRELHAPERYCPNPVHTNWEVECPECEVICKECVTPYPCRTIKLLNGNNQ